MTEFSLRYLAFVVTTTLAVFSYSALATSVLPPLQDELFVVTPLTVLTFVFATFAFPVVSLVRFFPARGFLLYVVFVGELVAYGGVLMLSIPFTTLSHGIVISLYSGHLFGFPLLLLLLPFQVWLTDGTSLFKWLRELPDHRPRA